MGTDIHAVVEMRGLSDGGYRWSPVGNGCESPDRNYILFATLAGVRLETVNGSLHVRGLAAPVTPISSPRGLPQDVSRATRRFLKTDDDYHSLSWIDSLEYETRVKGISASFDRWVDYNSRRWEPCLWRVVFGFDN